MKSTIFPELSVYIAGAVRKFQDVRMVKTRSGEWVLDDDEDLRLRRTVAEQILQDRNVDLSMEELRFFIDLLGLKQLDIAKALNLSESAISKWKNRETTRLSRAESVCLKLYFQDLLLAQTLKDLEISPLELANTRLFREKMAEATGDLIRTQDSGVISLTNIAMSALQSTIFNWQLHRRTRSEE